MSLPHRHFYPLASLLKQNIPPMVSVCFDHDNQLTSWSQFTSDIHHLKKKLADVSGQRVALCCGDSYFFSVGFMAVLSLGKQLVLPGNYQPAALAELSCHFDVLLGDDDVQQIATLEYCSIPESLQSRYAGEPIQLGYLNAQHDIILFTSGSSGTPKAIHKSLSQIESELAILDQLWGEQLLGKRIESTVSHQHIYGLLFRILWPLCSLSPFSRSNLEYPEQVIALASQDSALVSSPALLKRLSEEKSAQPYAMIFSSGGPLTLASAHLSQSIFGVLPTEVLGSTETGGIAFRHQNSETTPWQLFPGVKMDVNEESCLKLLSPHIDSSKWYQTADAIEIISSGTFSLKGRTDRIIKIEEKRISLVEVEKRVSQLPWIEEAAILPQQERERLSLSAVIVLSIEGEEELKLRGKGKFWILLRSELRQWLEPIAVPRRFRVVPEIPLNSQGKRLLSELEQLFHIES